MTGGNWGRTAGLNLKKKELLSLTSWAAFARGDGHGPVHVNLGGAFGGACDAAVASLTVAGRAFSAEELATKHRYKTLASIVASVAQRKYRLPTKKKRLRL